ncbi:hypothetical protein C0583_01050 [Candidatus Parcubacteria bacterium]|nr:MAG: hypothetical protein C0583_01050 [Candidatus Parcubacteria bacterium]
MMNEKKEKQANAWFGDALKLFARLNIWAVFPVLLAVLAGKYLDNYFGTKPWIMVALIVLAFNITVYKFWKEANKVL